MDEKEIDKVADTPIQDALIFCPMIGTFVLNETLGQGIFASETEMDQTEATKYSIVNKFISINFEEKDANRSKMQAITEYIKDVKENAKEYNKELNVAGLFSFEEESPIENWIHISIDSLKGSTIELPTNWMDISQLTNVEQWPLLYSLSMKRMEQERLKIPVEAFRFWEQRDFKELLMEVMDKSAFFKFSPEEEKMQGISYLLLEMFKIRRQINVLSMQPEIASIFFDQKWSKPITGYVIIKRLCKLKSNGIKKMFKELPKFKCENEVTEAKNYLIMALTAYKAAAEVIFDRMFNVTLVCQIIKPLIKQDIAWTHTAIFTLIRSAANIFLMKLLGEFYDLKSNLMASEEKIINDMKEKSIEEKSYDIISWFIHNEIPDKPITTPSRRSKQKKGINDDEERNKAISIESTQEDENKIPSVGCRIRILFGYDDNGKMNATITSTKEDVDNQFWYPKRKRVINEYKGIKDNYSWNDEFEFEGGPALCTNSPKIYDLRTPQKKSRKSDTYSDNTSEQWFDLSKDSKQMQSEKIKESIPAKPTSVKSYTASSNLVSLASEKTVVSLVDMILMEESSRDKHSKTGTVIKLKN